MEFSAQQIASLVEGTVEGNPEVKVNDFAKIEEGRPGCISFLANDKYEHYIYTTESSIVLVNETFRPREEVRATLIRVPDARGAVATLIRMYDSMRPRLKGIDSTAYIDPSATIGKDVYIGPFVAIGPKAVIGDGCVLHPHATVGARASIGNGTEMYSNSVVYHDCKVGANCILHAGCVIGADGFGFTRTEHGYEKIPQIGIAVLEDDVEIGANSCVDRAVMGQTVIRRGTKIDNLVQIAHNCEIGSHTVMSAQVGIAGSTKVGEWCVFGGQVGIAGHATIASYTQAGAQSGIANDVKKEKTNVMGYPAIDYNNFWRSSVVFRKLPDLNKQIYQMEKEIEALKKHLNIEN